MFKIRAAQVKAFEQAARKDFEDRMVLHLNEFFPDECRAMGEAALREMIRYGIGRAASHGIIMEPDVCKYLTLMMAYGRDFDCDPNHPWASAVLNDPVLTDPETKADCLYEAGLDQAAEASSAARE
jgi:hypothetical protein